SQPIVPSRASPLAPITAPIVAHNHSEAASITGGYVYHGKEFPELVGAYVYGDWATGKIWALWYDGEKVTRHEEIADTPHNIVTFGQDDDGEIYYLQFSNPTSIHRLKRNPQAGQPSSFPRSLSKTGVFADIKTLTPAHGVYPFSITQPLWEDGAVATQRLIGLKGESRISTTVVVYPEPNSHRKKIDYSSRWPAGAVLTRTITLGDLALTTAERSRRVETQLLHFDGQAWNAYTYRWNDAQTDAELVPASGEEVTFRVRPDPQSLDQEVRDYRWRFQSRAECLRCHNTWNNGALAFSPAQLQGVPGKQSHELVALGLIQSDYLEHTRAGLNPENPINGAARAVFHANCAHCHRSDAGGAVSVYLNTELLTAQMNVVGVEPAQGGLGLKNPKLIEPGDPWSSVIAVRMAKSGVGHMPLLGAKETDVKGLKAIEDWIARMTSTSAAPKPWDDTDWNEALITRELQTVNGAMRIRRAIDDGKLSVPLRKHAFQIAWASPETTVRDIFERFKPDALREKTLGSHVNVSDLLAVPGDAVRGSNLFTPEGKGASCLACHFVQGQGRHFGPDLTKIGAQQSAAQILESILYPSKLIAPEYRATIVELRDGSSQMGFVSRRDSREVVLKTPSGDSVSLPIATIASEKSLPNSLMPEGQLMGFTAQEAADLIAYLGSLGRRN
ncbi:MAG TPA: c-type cytochrome, partial [Opitutaceae bacterium]|nr:c-type cytochrome [Opitutaceae bacterium]